MKKRSIICLMVIILFTIALFGIITLNNHGIYFYPSLFVETFNSHFGGKSICVDNIYYSYINDAQKGIYVYHANKEELLFETEEIFSITALENKLICLSKNNIYIYETDSDRHYKIKDSDLKTIFETLNLSQEIGFYDSFRLSTENDSIKLYCFDSYDAFSSVRIIDIYPHISDKYEIFEIKDKDFNSVCDNCFVSPSQITADSFRTIMIATQCQGAGKVNFNTLPEINETLYKWQSDADQWELLYSVSHYEKIIYADNSGYIVYNHKRREYNFFANNGEHKKAIKCKKLKPFGEYTYQICNGQIFVLDRNFKKYDSIKL